MAIDIDPKKIEMAMHNAKIYGVEHKIDFVVADFMGKILITNLKSPINNYLNKRESLTFISFLQRSLPCSRPILFSSARRGAARATSRLRSLT